MRKTKVRSGMAQSSKEFEYEVNSMVADKVMGESKPKIVPIRESKSDKYSMSPKSQWTWEYEDPGDGEYTPHWEPMPYCYAESDAMAVYDAFKGNERFVRLCPISDETAPDIPNDAQGECLWVCIAALLVVGEDIRHLLQYRNASIECMKLAIARYVLKDCRDTDSGIVEFLRMVAG